MSPLADDASLPSRGSSPDSSTCTSSSSGSSRGSGGEEEGGAAGVGAEAGSRRGDDALGFDARGAAVAAEEEGGACEGGGGARAAPPPAVEEERQTFDLEAVSLLPGLVPPLLRPAIAAAAAAAAAASSPSSFPSSFPCAAYRPLLLPLPLEGICLQTQLTRCLGPIDGWLRYVRSPPLPAAAAAAAGQSPGPPPPPRAGGGESWALTGTLAEPLSCKFNMLHFTPLQRLGGSSSAYSLADQHCLEWELFAGNRAVNAAVRRAKADMAAWLLPHQQQQLQQQHAAAAASGGEGGGGGGEGGGNGVGPGSGLPSARQSPDAARLSRAAAEYRVWAHPRVEGAKAAVLARLVQHLEAHHGALSMVDVVLNHTSTGVCVCLCNARRHVCYVSFPNPPESCRLALA